MASTFQPMTREDKRIPEVFRMVKRSIASDQNVNNICDQISGGDDPESELPLFVMIRLIVIAITALENPRGSTLKDIRKLLCSIGIISESTDLRPAMIAGLKLGAIARPVWAVQAGVYGKYVEGDGIPIFAGRKSVPKQRRHRSSVWVADKPKKKKRAASKKGSAKKKRRGSEMRVDFVKRRW